MVCKKAGKSLEVKQNWRFNIKVSKVKKPFTRQVNLAEKPVYDTHHTPIIYQTSYITYLYVYFNPTTNHTNNSIKIVKVGLSLE